jgi:hypothetical protein
MKGDDRLRFKEKGPSSKDDPEQKGRVGETDKAKEKSKPKEKAPPPTAASGEPMIIVHVNDRLGTKAAIPCLASDPISQYQSLASFIRPLTNYRALQSTSCSTNRSRTS